MSFDFSIVPTATLALMMLALGMELRPEDFLRLAREPRAAIAGILGQLVLLPAVALAIAMLLPLSPATSMGLVLLAACPGGATSNMFSRYARGDVALSISLTAVSSLAAPVSVPLIVGIGLALLAGPQAAIQVSTAEMVTTLIATTAVPVLMGMAMLHWRPAATVRIRGKLLATATTILVLLVIGLMVNTTRAQPDVIGMFARSSIAVILLISVCSASGIAVSRVLGLSRPRERTLVLELGIQNINIALVVALTFLEQPAYLGPTLVSLPFMLLLGGLVVCWGVRGHRTA
jgi:bile acid:Na+ symporter, BASS family